MKNESLSIDEVVQSIKRIMQERSFTADDDILELTNIAAPHESRAEEHVVAEESVKAEFKKLVDTAQSKNRKSIEDLVAEIVKPHIAAWLDKNLLEIVKKAVEEEIRKLVP